MRHPTREPSQASRRALDCEQRAARIAVAQPAAHALRRGSRELERTEEIDYAKRLIPDYETRIHRHSANGPRKELDALDATRHRLRLAALHAERAELHSPRDSQAIKQQTLLAIEMEIDHAETRASGIPRGEH